jgi:hypothetical protein
MKGGPIAEPKVDRLKLIRKFTTDHPIKIIKIDNSPVSITELPMWEDYIDNYLYCHADEDEISINEVLNGLLSDMDDFLKEVTTFFECGAVVKIIPFELSKLTKIELTNFNRKFVYEVMWPDNSISERYGKDFVFDISEFGYEYFKFNGNTYLISGMAG